MTAVRSPVPKRYLRMGPTLPARAPAAKPSAASRGGFGPVPYAPANGMPLGRGDAAVSLKPPIGTGALVALAELVVVANRLPVDRVPSTDEDGGETWRRSPGGLVTALEPVMRDAEGAWVGWVGPARPRRRALRVRGHAPVPVRAERRRRRATTTRASRTTRSGRCTTTSSRRPATAACGGRPTSRSIGGSRMPRPPSPPRARPSGCRTTSCSSCRACCARPGRISRSATSTTFPSRHTVSTHSCPGVARCCEGLLGADVIGFQRVADAAQLRPRRAPAAAHTRPRHPASRSPNADGTTRTRPREGVPDLDRRRVVRRAGPAAPTSRPAPPRSARASATPRP